MNIWLTMLAAGLLTYTIRLSFIILLAKVDVPDTLRRALHYVPPAVLSAIVFPEMFLRDGAIDISFGNARLLSGIAAALIAWLTKNILLTLLTGMAVLLILQALGLS